MRDTLTALAANIRGRTGLAEQTSVDGDDDEHRESGDVVLDDGRSERDSLPQGRQIGVLSTTFLIVNRIIGAGVFVTPSAILQSSGSIGLSLIMWALGALIATAGLLVYLEWGTALPQNGGEKRYLEFAYRKPRFLAICMFATYAVLLGWCAGNSIVVGEYLLAAAGKQSDRWNSRAIGLGVITFALLVHGLALKWGLRIMNLLGVFKSALLLFIVFTGFAALAGHTRLEEPPHNFRNAFEGTTADAYGISE